jgi:hypothetical protein
VGVDNSAIAGDYAISSVYIQPTFEKPLFEEPEIMLDFLAHLDTKYGGIRSYLLESGVSEVDLIGIRDHLLS